MITLGFGHSFHTSLLAKNASLARTVYRAYRDRRLPVSLLNRFDAAFDLPTSLFPLQAYNTWPSAKFIYVQREPHEWYERATVTIPEMVRRAEALRRPGTEYFSAFLREVFMERDSMIPIKDEKRSLAWFRCTKKKIESHIPASQLLITSVGSGWQPICDFLNVSIPNESFPRTNSFSRIMGLEPEL